MAKKIDAVYESVYKPFMQTSPTRSRGNVTEAMYMRVLTEMCLNRFSWVGLPSSVDTRFLEMALFYQGLCVFYYDTEYSRYMALRATGAGRPNMYDNPTTFTVLGNSMVNKTMKGGDCVPIWANMLRIPDLDIVRIYSDRLSAIDRTIELNIIQQRRPYIVSVPEGQRLTAMNALKNVTDGEFAIFETEDFSTNSSINVFNTQLEKDALLNNLLAKQKIWNECMTLLGINNANQDKKERLVADEVAANNGQVVASRNSGLASRQLAVQLIQSKYELTGVSVQWNMDNDAVPDMPGLQVEDNKESEGV